MLFGVLWTAVLTLLTPILTTVGGFEALFVIRLLEGIGQVCQKLLNSDPCPGTLCHTSILDKRRHNAVGL